MLLIIENTQESKPPAVSNPTTKDSGNAAQLAGRGRIRATNAQATEV